MSLMDDKAIDQLLAELSVPAAPSTEEKEKKRQPAAASYAAVAKGESETDSSDSDYELDAVEERLVEQTAAIERHFSTLHKLVENQSLLLEKTLEKQTTVLEGIAATLVRLEQKTDQKIATDFVPLPADQKALLETILKRAKIAIATPPPPPTPEEQLVQITESVKRSRAAGLPIDEATKLQMQQLLALRRAQKTQ